MPQQRSLFSFYCRGAAEANPNECFFGGAELQRDGDSVDVIPNRGSLHSSVKEHVLQNDLLKRIQQKFVRKDKSCQPNVESSVLVNASRATDLKRTREDELSSTAASSLYPISEKRSLLSEALGGHGSSFYVSDATGLKRACEADPTSFVRATSSDPVPEKRTRLLEALGVDDFSSKGGAWATAKAKFEWMSPSNIRDGKGRRPDDPLYDARTLHIPDYVFRNFSASQKQYWATKSQYMDTLLFFKVGKFYELYEIDAEIGHKELDWKLIVSGVGKCRQVGCPESGIDDAVQKLVSRGYKVGRMEQLETAAQARANGGPKVTVQRELTQVQSPSTIMDGNIGPAAVHLLALKEEVQEGDMNTMPGEGVSRIGFAFVDAAAGSFYVGSFRDDGSRSALVTLLTQVVPQEVLYEIGGVTDETRKALRCSSSPGLLPLILTPLQPNVEFMETADVLRMLQSNHYFKSGKDCCINGIDPLPPSLEPLVERDLAITALGALACHLSRMKCDAELLPNGVLLPYEVYKGYLRLDGQTVDNLELLRNRANGGKAGTLLSYLDSCVTQFGKRLLRQWICHPLQNIGDIEYRLDSVDEFRSLLDVSASVRVGLRKLPDLERLVARIRGLAASPMLGLVPMAARKVHQKRLKTFCSTVLGMRAAFDLLLCLAKFSSEFEPFKSRLLQSASALPDSEAAQNCLAELELSIDQGSKSPRLVCQVAAPSLSSMELLAKVHHSQDDEDDLETEAKMLSNLIDLFNEQGFHWRKVVEMLGQLDVLISFASAINGSNGPTCRPHFVTSGALKKGGSILRIKGLWHPYAMGGQGGAFVPNDIELGNNAESMIKPCALLLTGPNMGGKSTLLRATCLTVILAQLGCYVPCESCTMSPVDTIFTRLGASDNIMAGESTFMVECAETASVLHHATSDSLVVLDELGRGTSTFDGYAIAYAVFHELVKSRQCRLMFATHYHPLTEEFATNPYVRIAHMACSLELPSRVWNDANSDHGEDALEKELVFLYKLTDGACPKSYGLRVALLAGIPGFVVKNAENAAGAFQKRLPTTLGKIPEACDQKRFVEAVISALEVVPLSKSCDNEDDSYLNLLCLWHELRRNESLL